MKGLRARWARWQTWSGPRRRLKITRIGRTYLFITLGVGLAALNTGNNLLYLPVDKILEQRRSNTVTPAPRDSAPATVPAAPAAGTSRDRTDLRTRGTR